MIVHKVKPNYDIKPGSHTEYWEYTNERYLQKNSKINFWSTNNGTLKLAQINLERKKNLGLITNEEIQILNALEQNFSLKSKSETLNMSALFKALKYTGIKIEYEQKNPNPHPFYHLNCFVEQSNALIQKLDLELIIKELFKEVPPLAEKISPGSISTLYKIFKIKGLDKMPLINHLNLSDTDLANTDFLKDVPNLEILVLKNNVVDNYNGLRYCRNLKSLDVEIVPNKKINLTQNILELQKLEHLNIAAGVIDIENINKLKNLISLSICGKIYKRPKNYSSDFTYLHEFKLEKLNKVPNLKHFNKLKSIGLSYNNISSIDEVIWPRNIEVINLKGNPITTSTLQRLLDCKKNGNIPYLDTVWVNETNINWLDGNAGNIANELLKNYGVNTIGSGIKIEIPATKYNIIEEVLKVIDPQNKFTDQQRETLSLELKLRINSKTLDLAHVIPSEKGFTSTSGFQFFDNFIKLDSTTRLKIEHQIYNLDLGEFKKFMAEEKGFIEHDDLSVLVLNNLAKLENTEKTCIYKGEDFMIYLMSLFHKEAKKYSDRFNQISYQGANGESHYDEIKIPKKNIDGEGYYNFNDFEINIPKIMKYITNYRQIQSVSDTLIDGDWKEDNIVNGRKVDFAMVGRGYEVDEIAYFFSDYYKRKEILTLKQFHEKLDKYISIRKKHDTKFEENIFGGYAEFSHKLADSSLLTQLTLRMSVMNKRNMLDPEKINERKYYEFKINQILKEGKLI